MAQRLKVLKKADASYTFSKFFELPFEIEDVLADLDCQFTRQPLTLPRSDQALPGLATLIEQIEDGLRYVGITSEQARREFLIAPIIRELCRTTQQQVRVEYAVTVNDGLKGTLDYYFQTSPLLVSAAKRENLDNGFTQLAAEMIALDQWADTDAPQLYGAVTTGQDWRFGIYDRQAKAITEDLKLYRVPEELETLVRILVSILQTT
jgi:hypothetical protein